MNSPIGPPPEAVVIRRAREAAGLSPEEAAARLKIKLRGSRWRQIEAGYVRVQGENRPTRASDSTLAHMAYDLSVEPQELDHAGRHEAAEVLRTIKRREARQGSPRQTDIAAYFRDQSIPIDERRRVAEELWRILPFVFRGEEPPPNSGRGNGSEESA